MKKIINSLKRTHWFKTSIAFLICLLFLIFPSCQKDELNQDSLLNIDKMSVSASSASSSAKMYWGMRNFTKDWGGPGYLNGNDQICTSYFENFGNFVLKVQNMNGGVAKISKLEIRIDDELIVTAKGLTRDYFVAKTLRSLSNCAHLNVIMEGDQGCSIQVWIEGTFKGLGTVYGKHLYYKSLKNDLDFWNANGYCNSFGGHLVIINNAKENSFVSNLCKNGNFFMGLSDFDQNQVWRWVDGTLCRVLNWNYSQCPGEVHWGDPNCTIVSDYGYNNWAKGEPNNCGGTGIPGACIDESIAVFNNDGTWNDIPPGQGNFVMEWEFIPISGVINDLFRQEYPEYQYPW